MEDAAYIDSPNDPSNENADCKNEAEQQTAGKKKKRNRRSKNKANHSVTNEMLTKLDTDDLVDFINNCGSKKDDLKK